MGCELFKALYTDIKRTELIPTKAVYFLYAAGTLLYCYFGIGKIAMTKFSCFLNLVVDGSAVFEWYKTLEIQQIVNVSSGKI